MHPPELRAFSALTFGRTRYTRVGAMARAPERRRQNGSLTLTQDQRHHLSLVISKYCGILTSARGFVPIPRTARESARGAVRSGVQQLVNRPSLQSRLSLGRIPLYCTRITLSLATRLLPKQAGPSRTKMNHHGKLSDPNLPSWLLLVHLGPWCSMLFRRRR